MLSANETDEASSLVRDILDQALQIQEEEAGVANNTAPIIGEGNYTGGWHGRVGGGVGWTETGWGRRGWLS